MGLYFVEGGDEVVLGDSQCWSKNEQMISGSEGPSEGRFQDLSYNDNDGYIESSLVPSTRRVQSAPSSSRPTNQEKQQPLLDSVRPRSRQIDLHPSSSSSSSSPRHPVRPLLTTHFAQLCEMAVVTTDDRDFACFNARFGVEHDTTSISAAERGNGSGGGGGGE
jgi:hypothetical protein